MSDSSIEQPTQPLIEHLLELRRRLVWTVCGIVLCFLCLMPFAQDLYSFAAKPLMASLPDNTSMIATDVIAPFFVPVKVTLMAAFLVSLPHTLYQMWAFVAPALYQNEKRLITPLVLSSLILFAVGMAFAYFLVFPVIFQFLAGVTPVGVNMATDIDKYLSFILGMFVAFGMTFEVPVVVVLLAKMGIVSTEQLKSARPYVIVGAFVVAAIVTPPDVISQILLAVPLVVLYEAGIWFSRFIRSKEQSDTDDNPPQPPATTA
ncbi:twin-arginine translocase subunit TatC [Neisseria animalis]|uniref:Sec-independent protein translocase protein TatC n=1 Tax=Neisseria animalis TaxID=492 RepID=A0A5P3MSJ9_NEIAN|nr:twin-arginine translocase subunit TatC [Neisseria animalis]QEY23619.1 twin-arginine translocase subunit TatC [Neisseria animalis]ROW32764.1 twin-arginine translocase subunit TatC [Neisseria animalis]VEE09349.1 sec-independent protein translocase component [Neisseria animalis]